MVENAGVVWTEDQNGEEKTMGLKCALNLPVAQRLERPTGVPRVGVIGLIPVGVSDSFFVPTLVSPEDEHYLFLRQLFS